jgi:ATP-dependent exoDNAse (exonuclease V) beta subunit
MDRLPTAGSGNSQVREDDFAPMLAAAIDGQLGASASAAPHTQSGSSGAASDRLRGTLVHRMLHRLGAAPVDGDTQRLRRLAVQLVRPEERDELDDIDGVCTEAVASYESLVSRPEVRELYGRGEAFHEVPFTRTADGRTVRGTIDCLVRWGDQVPSGAGGIVVLEFKTGRPAPEHAQQALAYREAAEALFPGLAVEAHLVYPDRVELVGAPSRPGDPSKPE